MDTQEKIRLLDNINFIIDSAHQTDITIDGAPVSKKKLILSLGMSYNTYLKLIKNLEEGNNNYTPQEGTLLKFVKCFNEYWTPEIDVSKLKRRNLAEDCDNGVFTRKQTSSKDLQWYAGPYYCYYNSFSYNELRYALLNIYEHDNQYDAQLINGLKSIEEIDTLINNLNGDANYRNLHRDICMEQFFNRPSMVKSKFDNFTKHSKAKHLTFSFFNGPVTSFPSAMELNLFSEDCSYKKILTFTHIRNLNYSQCIGLFGADLTLAHDSRFSYMNYLRFFGTSRKLLNDTESIKKLLQIEPTATQNINLSIKDPSWFDLIIERSPKV